MADDPNPVLRAELTAARDVVASQVRGLNDLAAASISPDLTVEVNKQSAARTRRRDLISTAIQKLDETLHALNVLQADGYPALNTTPMPAALLNELRGEEDDLEAGIGVFAPAPASAISVALGAPTERPPAPSQGA